MIMAGAIAMPPMPPLLRPSLHLACALLCAATAALVLLPDAQAQTQSPPPTLILKEDEAHVGSNLRRPRIEAEALPLNHTYEQLSEADRRRLHEVYPDLKEGDEPPYPLRGLRAVYEPLSRDREGVIDEPMQARIMVGPDGRMQSLKMIKSPGFRAEAFLTKVMSKVEFKPARCGGEPCAMEFPVSVTPVRRF
jgi:hypothetical protein